MVVQPDHKIEFSKFSKSLGTRRLGAVIREEIIDSIHKGNFVILDFNSVRVVSNSFVDECIVKLLDTFTMEELKANSTFVGLGENVKCVLRWSLSQRLSPSSTPSD